MSELVQIVCTNNAEKCPVALTPFLTKAEARAEMDKLKKDGHGERSTTRPKLSARNQSGATVDLAPAKTDPATK